MSTDYDLLTRMGGFLCTGHASFVVSLFRARAALERLLFLPFFTLGKGRREAMEASGTSGRDNKLFPHSLERFQQQQQWLLITAPRVWKGE